MTYFEDLQEIECYETIAKKSTQSVGELTNLTSQSSFTEICNTIRKFGNYPLLLRWLDLNSKEKIFGTDMYPNFICYVGNHYKIYISKEYKNIRPSLIILSNERGTKMSFVYI